MDSTLVQLHAGNQCQVNKQLHQLGRCASVLRELSCRLINRVLFVFPILKYIITHNHAQNSLKSILITLYILMHYFHTIYMYCNALQCTTMSCDALRPVITALRPMRRDLCLDICNIVYSAYPTRYLFHPCSLNMCPESLECVK